MMAGTAYTQPAVPGRALVLSAGALLVPLLANVAQLPEMQELNRLLWLLALVPPFLLAYHRGWRGAATALAAGMAVLALAQVLENALGGAPPDSGLLFQAICGYILISLGIGWLSELLHQARARAETLALQDPLTLLPNRRCARQELDARFHAAAAHGAPLAAVLFDIDCFKQYNDRFGHLAGDEAITDFAGVLMRSSRSGELAARYGGEEFLMLLQVRDTFAMKSAVRRVFAGLAHARRGHENGPFTVSAGIAAWSPTMRSADDLLAAADRALYAAKDAGRNCCVVDGMEGMRAQEVRVAVRIGAGVAAGPLRRRDRRVSVQPHLDVQPAVA